MIGGTVIEVCDNPHHDKPTLYVNVAQRPYGRTEECAINVVKNRYSDQIQIGDSVWWQARTAFWTPQDAVSFADWPIPRVGYSGVQHPSQVSKAGATP